MKDKKSKGFTLIELLIVVAIISLLASIILTATQGARSKARDVIRFADVNSIIQALYLYKTTHGVFPPDFSTLMSSGVLLKSPVDPVYAQPYEMYWYKDSPGGPRQTIFIGTWPENSSSPCGQGGMMVSTNPPHCHIFVPAPRNCSDPWEIQAWPGPADCQLLI